MNQGMGTAFVVHLKRVLVACSRRSHSGARAKNIEGTEISAGLKFAMSSAPKSSIHFR